MISKSMNVVGDWIFNFYIKHTFTCTIRISVLQRSRISRVNGYVWVLSHWFSSYVGKSDITISFIRKLWLMFSGKPSQQTFRERQDTRPALCTDAPAPSPWDKASSFEWQRCACKCLHPLASTYLSHKPPVISEDQGHEKIDY